MKVDKIMKLDRFKEIFRSSFPDSEEWCDWFFGSVVSEECVYLASANDGKAASTLLAQPYELHYEGALLPTVYISCVATLPEYRSCGLASAVLKDAMIDARSKGAVMAELIPAEDHLYYFYSRLGFATVFYADVEHYTSLHTFRPGRGNLVEPTYELFHAIELAQGCSVLHSRADYENILSDMSLDGAPILLAATDDEGGSAMLFAVADGDDAVKVKWLAGQSKYAVRTLLAELRRHIGEKDVTVVRPPESGDRALMRPYGMGRVLRPGIFLSVLAAAHPELAITVRIGDDIIPSNSGIYAVADGKCTFTPAADTPRGLKADLDVTAETFTAVVFSSHATSEIIGLPASRPAMGLMLDQ